MKAAYKLNLVAVTFVGVMACIPSNAHAQDPLPSWDDTAPKQAIVTFVEKVTRAGSPDFVPVAERTATFDNDGTLWSEKPLPVQLFFMLDRVKVLAPQHPEWQTKEPFVSVLKGDLNATAIGHCSRSSPRPMPA
jgi:hypothetical protein